MRRSQIKHTMLDFEPLDISCSIACVTPHSPLAQVSNSILNEFEPDRSITPTIIRPYINVNDKDGIFQAGNANARLPLESIIWRINGIDIKDIPEFANKYVVITTENELRGSLKLYRNTPINEKLSITFEGKFEDWRRGKIETVQSNTLLMQSTDLGEDVYRVTVDKPTIIYRPVADNLFMYDWMLANRLIEGGNRAAYIDENSFEKVVNVQVNTGERNVPISDLANNNISIEFREKNKGLVAPGTNNPEIIEVVYPKIKVDARLIQSKEYEVALIRNNKDISVVQFSIVRDVDPIHECTPMFGNDISPHQQIYFNYAIANLKDSTLTYPEMHYSIRWFTEAKIFDKVTQQWVSAGEKYHNVGRKLEIELKDIGVGMTKNDNYFAVGFDIEARGSYEEATDANGNLYQNSRGETFII